MPRSRPGRLRADRRHDPRTWDGPPPARIHRLSTPSSLAIHRAEMLSTDYYVYPGATERALRRYRAFVLSPGHRTVYPQEAHCSCRGCSLDDVRHARDVLDRVLRQLPARARGELRRRMAALDAAYLERTLPDPFADQRQWRSDLWWRRRLTDGREGW
ncbi:hypothetical protein ACFQ6N_19675 [Kitasatospora sp. NPDC056446]|uniref:hypothetical protein n=1 Tax=Kitasatospora sp. NPDC056446 TaxID=3345819 RepID=UPI0036C052E1